MIINQVQVYYFCQMENDLKEILKMIWLMDKEYYTEQKENQSKESG